MTATKRLRQEMKRLLRTRAAFALGLVFAASAPLQAANPPLLENIEFESLMAPPSFPLAGSPPVESIQSHFILFTQDIAKVCSTRFKIELDSQLLWKDLFEKPASMMTYSQKVACTWPLLVNELDLAATALAHKGAQPQPPFRLALTLAAGLYEFDLFSESGILYDAHLTRWMFAIRNLRAAWPYARLLVIASSSKTPAEQLRFARIESVLEPWLTSLSPWSFAFRLYENTRCASGVAVCHGQKLVILSSILEAERQLLENAQWRALRKKLAASEDIQLSEMNSYVYSGTKALFETVIGLGGKHYPISHISYSEAKPASLFLDLKLYHETVLKDFEIPLHSPVTFSLDPCENILSSFAGARAANEFDWTALLPKDPPACLSLDDRDSQLDQTYLRALEAKGLSQRVSVLSVRQNLLSLLNPVKIDAGTFVRFSIARLVDDMDSATASARIRLVAGPSTSDRAPSAPLVKYLVNSSLGAYASAIQVLENPLEN